MSGIPPAYPHPGGFDPAQPMSSEPLTSDAPCRKCGYNLRGLNLDGRCPECGTPVGLSLYGDLLRYSDPNWVRTLYRGVRTIIWGIVVAFLGAILMIVLGVAMPSLLAVAPLASVIAGLMWVVGAWMLTEPDPSGIGEDKYGTSRQIIRFAIAVGLVNTILSWVQQLTTLPPSARITLGVIGGLAGLIGVVGQFAQLNYLSKLALRIPDQPLSDRAKFLMWAIGISYSALLLAGLVIAISAAVAPGAGGGPPPGLMVGGCIAGIAGLAVIIFGIMYLLMLEKMGKRFKEQALAAEQTWAGVERAISPPAM